MSDGAYLARIDYPIITDTSLFSIDPDGTLRAYEHAMRVEKTKDRKGRDTVKATLDERWNANLEPKLNRLHLAAGSRVYGTGENGLVAAVEFSEQSGNPHVAWSTTVDGEPLSLIAADGKLFASTDRGAIYCFAADQPDAGQPIVIDESAPGAKPDPVHDEWTPKVASILNEADVKTGYCVLLGIGTGRVLDELISQSDLHVVALDPDAEKVAAQRRRLDALGLYGSRAAVMAGDLFSVSLPPYLAQLIVSEDLSASGFDRGKEFASRVFECLRPYGGTAYLPIPSERFGDFVEAVQLAALSNAELRQSNTGSHALLTRVGQLPGGADWTHQYSDAGNSVASHESRVKAPLGLLWFGGPSNEKVLPRHGHGPTPQVAGGRLFIEGRDMLRAVDVYTGQLLWEHDFPNLGQYYDYTSHEPGANAIGSNYVSLPDNIYVIQDQTCYRLDSATGETLAQFHAPPAAGEASPPELGYLAVVGDVLITGVQPLYYRSYAFDARQLRKYDADKGRALMAEIRKWRDFEVQDFSGAKPEPAVLVDNLNRLMFGPDLLATIPDDIRAQAQSADLEQQLQAYVAGSSERETEDEAVHLKRRLLEKYYDLPEYEDSPVGTYGNLSRRSSQRLVGLNRLTGEVLWETSARHAFRHNAIAAGSGKVFALDRLEDAALDHQRRRGLTVTDQRRIIAVDLATGQELWSTEDRIFGTWLGYSAEYDVLVQAGSLAGDRAPDEVGAGIVAYRGSDGKVLWQSDAKYSGPLLLHRDTVYSQPGPGTAFNLLTGEQKMRIHPVSGDLVEWTYGRDGGCNTAICSEHLITFRSSAAGFFDLAGDSGTGNWGGFRSSCTSNLIPADGVLNAPDYTRTCTCAFQNRSSLALVHMPEVETWTFNRFKWDGARVRHLGLNFGAPGDRRAPDGQLWLDFPSVGGDSPDVPVEVAGDSVAYLRHHPSRISGHPLNWVGCCAVTGASTIKVSLDDEEAAPERPYTVRLYFSELEGRVAGERIFDVSIQDTPVLSSFDIVRESGAPDRVVVKEVKQVQAGRELKVTLTPKTGRTILCGIEILADGW
jgi:outer membrane protein assembly factor BamB